MMGNSLVKTQLKDVKDFLVNTIITLEDYLNETTISQLIGKQIRRSRIL